MACLVSFLFRHLVLVSFVWSTLYPTFVWSQFLRAQPEFAVIEQQDDLQFLRFGIEINTLEDQSPEALLLKDTFSTGPLRIPIGPTEESLQTALDALYKDSIYQDLTFVDDGLSWSSFGLDFVLHNTGHLRVKKREGTENGTIAHNLRLVNPHGAIFFEDTLQFDHLVLTAKDVVQQGTLAIQNLEATIDGQFTNNGSLSFVHTLFHKPSAHNNNTTLTTFLNTKEGRLIGNALTIEGHCVLENAGVFSGKDKIVLSHEGSTMNAGTMMLEGKVVANSLIVTSIRD